MAITEWVLPADSDAWPCPEACGGFTDDPYGGPCAECWDRITRRPEDEDGHDH